MIRPATSAQLLRCFGTVTSTAAKSAAVRCFGTSTQTAVKSEVMIGPFGAGGEVSGFTEDGWGGIRDAFESNFAENLELCSQLVIYKDGEVVVDLVGTSGDPQYTADSLQCVFSSGKNMEAVAVAMLVDRGLLAYDDAVSKIWPEFGQNGKESVSVADVMRHEGGVPLFTNPSDPYDKSKDAIVSPEQVRDVVALEKLFENAAKFPVDAPRCYHAITRGWIVNALLRRVDPAGRSLSQFIRDEISTPLGITYFCGIPESEQSQFHYADMTQIPLPYNVLFEVLPAKLGFGSPELANALENFADKSNPILRPAVSWISNPPTPAFNNTAEGRALEISSAGMYANARAMAKVNAALAGDGSVDGVRLLSAEALAESLSQQKSAHDVALSGQWSFSQGGFCDFGASTSSLMSEDDPQAYAGFHGWGGWGGSVSIWHPEAKVGFSYTMNAMSNYLVGGPRTRKIMFEIQKLL